MRTIRNIFWSILAAWLLSAGSATAQSSATGGTGSEFTFKSPLKDIGGIDELVKAVIDKIVLPLGLSVAVIFIIYAGFLYVKAQGKPGEIANAHKALAWTLVGTAVLLGAWVLAGLVGGTIEQLKAP